MTNRAPMGFHAKADAASVESDNSPEADTAHWLHDGGSYTTISAVCEHFWLQLAEVDNNESLLWV